MEGKLIIAAYAARMALPIFGVSVTVSAAQNPVLIAHRTTNENGMTDAICLNTPDIDLSLAPNDQIPYATCNVRLVKNGYYDVLVENVQVFAERESIQQMEMIPLMEYAKQNSEKRTFIITPQNL